MSSVVSIPLPGLVGQKIFSSHPLLRSLSSSFELRSHNRHAPAQFTTACAKLVASLAERDWRVWNLLWNRVWKSERPDFWPNRHRLYAPPPAPSARPARMRNSTFV